MSVEIYIYYIYNILNAYIFKYFLFIKSNYCSNSDITPLSPQLLSDIFQKFETCISFMDKVTLCFLYFESKCHQAFKLEQNEI